MKLFVRVFLPVLSVVMAGVMLMSVVSCSKDDDQEQQESRSVLVYVAAQNSLVGNLNNDVIELLSGASGMGEYDRLMLFVDDNNNSRIYEIRRSTTDRTLYNMTPVYKFDSNLNAATPMVFNQVLDYFFQHYKATDYGLVMWSHGSGWINATNRVQQNYEAASRRAFAVDTSGETTRMLITDMASVLSRYPKFEYILFDACFMQTIEVLYELRASAKYIIGSPAEIPGAGAPYRQMMPALFKRASADKVAESIVNIYGSYYNSTISNANGVVLSAVKTDEIDAFVSEMSYLFGKYSFLDESKYTNCLNYYPYEWNYLGAAFISPDSYDIKGIIKAVVTDRDDYQQWETALSQLSPYTSIGRSWYSGYTHNFQLVDAEQCGAISMYLPLEKYKNDNYFDFYGEIQWGKLFEIK